MEHKKNIGIWVRVSTEYQVKDESLEHHERRAKLYAEAKGWNVVEVYKLDAVSGKSVMEHPEAKRMLKDIKGGKITGLIFSKLARLARNTKELLDFSEIFRFHDADLISLQESIDTSTPAGRLFYTMIAAMAQWEREEISERVAASVPIRAKMGKPTGGQATFGYRWDGNQFVIEEKEAPIRKLIYELFLKYRRKKTTASELNKLGYRTRNGSRFSDTSIDRLLRDSSAKGERKANYTKSLGEGKKWVLKPVEEWVVTSCPLIVSVEIWNECNRLLEEQESKRKKPGPRSVYLLAGFIHCSCGKKMYVFHNNNHYFCKSCKNKVAVSDIDEIYHDQLKSFLWTDRDISEYIQNTDGLIKEKEQLLKVITDEHISIQRKMDDLVKLRLSGELDEIARHYKPLENQLKQIEFQLPEMQAEIDFLKVHYYSSGAIIQESKDLYNKWASLSYEEKRQVIEIITEKIIVDKEEINIKLSYLPTPLKIKENGNTTMPVWFLQSSG